MAEDRKSKLNGWLWRLVFAALGAVFAAGVTWGIALNRLDAVCDDVQDHEDRLRVVERGITTANNKLDFLVKDAKEK